MRRILGSLVVGIVVTSTTLAFAQEAKKAPDKGGAPPKVKVFDFTGDTIEGDLIKPEGSVVDARDFAKHSSLIRIRTNFIQEIIKSAEDL
jgi:hypothetical protein